MNPPILTDVLHTWPHKLQGVAIRISPKPLKDGGAKEARTPDLLNAIQALYQLSYDPIHETER